MLKKIIWILIILFVLFGNISTVCADDVDSDESEGTIIENEITEEAVASKGSKLLTINSRRYVVYDRISGTVIFGKDEDIKTAMASTTKIMTATIVLEQSNLNEEVEVSGKAGGTGGSRLGLKKGDKVAVNDLLYGLMLRSRK